MFDADLVRECLRHVIKCQGGGTGSGESLHFNAGAVGCFHGAGDVEGTACLHGFDFKFAAVDREGMTEGDPIRGAFDGLGAGDDRDGVDRPLLGCEVVAAQFLPYFSRKADGRFRGGASARDGFIRDVDHGRLGLVVEVSQFWFYVIHR